MVRSAATAAMVLAAFGSARVMHVDPVILQPFQSPVSVLGSIMLFLCLLIMSNSHYRHRDEYRGYSGGAQWGDYIRRNLVFLACAMLGIYVGSVYGLGGMANTATTFLVLWGLEKYCDFHTRNRWNMWVLALLGSALMYKLALWLHANPNFVVSLFNSV